MGTRRVRARRLESKWRLKGRLQGSTEMTEEGENEARLVHEELEAPRQGVYFHYSTHKGFGQRMESL